MLSRAVVALCFAFPHVAQGAAIGPGSIGDSAITLNFDSHPHGTLVSDEYEHLGVLLRSGEPPGPELSSNPADWIPSGGSTAPFLWVSIATPSLGTSSPPNMASGLMYAAPDYLVGCVSCRKIVTFLYPYPTQVGLYITDADARDFAEFYGLSGLLGTVTVSAGFGGPVFVGWEEPAGIQQVEVGWGSSIDDLRYANPVPEPSSFSLLGLGLVVIATFSRRRLPGSRSPTGRCS